jgi:polysaccharide export outer membrane protein
MRNLMLTMILGWSASWAQTVPPAQTNPAAGMSNLPQMQIGRNDLLNVQVYDSPELSGTVRVDADGKLELPMLGRDHSIQAEGMLPQQLGEKIASALERAQLVVHPLVTVLIAEYQSRTVTVVGAVRHPISFQAYGRITLLDAIGRAEGLTETAGDDILISDGGSSLSKRVSVSTLMSKAGIGVDILLHGGEEVRIPEQGRVSVLGNVKHPGVFPIKTDDDSSLLTLLARSEGVTPNATNEAYIYRLVGAGQPRSEVPVDLKLILNRKEPDIHLEPGDILYVPDNHARRLTMSVLEHIATLGASTTSAFIYAGIH